MTLGSSGTLDPRRGPEVQAADGGERVCLFIGALKAGGAERVLAWLGQQLAAHGARPVLVTLDDGTHDRIKLDPSVEQAHLGFYGPSPLFLKPFGLFRRVLALRRFLRSEAVDVIVAFMPQESVMAVLATSGLPTRVVISERTSPWKKSPSRVWVFLRWMLYRSADIQVAQTLPIANWLETNARCRSVRVIPNAVQYPLPTSDPIVRPEMEDGAGKRKILAVGTKPFQKGFDLLIEAFSRVALQQPDWDLYIVGLGQGARECGIDEESLRDLAARRELLDRIHFVGPVGNLSDWYSCADLFVLSSRYEGFPNVLIEAMSHGCACAAFDCETGPSEIIVHGVNGLLVADGSISDLATALETCLTTSALRTKLAENAVQVRHQYSPAEIFELWRSAMGLVGQKSYTAKEIKT